MRSSVWIRGGRVAVGAAAVASTAAGLMLLGFPDHVVGETLAIISPWSLAAALIVVAGALLLQTPRLVLALALLGAAGPALMVVPEVAKGVRLPAEVQDNTPTLRIVSVNLWSENDDVLAFTTFIRVEEPHIILVQEAFGHWDDVLNALPVEYRIQAGCQHGSDCNVAVVSRLSHLEELARPTHRMAGVRLRLPEGFEAEPVEVVSVHLDRGANEWRGNDQLNEVREMAQSLGPRAIVAGDFNATPWTRTLRDLDEAIPLERRTRALFTWPTPSRPFTNSELRAPIPIVPIDHVYAGSDWRVVDIRRGPDIGSDHYPVIATLALIEQ